MPLFFIVCKDDELGRWLAKILLYYVGEQGHIEDYTTFEHLVCQELPATRVAMQTIFKQMKQKSMEKGAENARQQFARRLLAPGNLSIEEISHLTNLPAATIRHLAGMDEEVA